MTGERVWTTNESLTAVFNVGSPIAADGTVYFTGEVTGEGGHVFAVDAETGREQWRLKPIDSADTMGTLRYDSGTLYGTSWVGDSDDETVAWAVDTAERTTR